MESVNHYLCMFGCSSFNSSPTSWLGKQTLGEKGQSDGFYSHYEIFIFLIVLFLSFCLRYQVIIGNVANDKSPPKLFLC